MRLLVDTNVILDLLLKRGENCKDAIEFFVWCKRHKNWTYITSMSLRDIEYVAMKNFHDKKKTNSLLIDVYSLITKVIGISADSAINSIFEDYKDFEDELIIQAAKEEMLDAIVTNNVKDFQDKGMPAFTPREIMNSTAFVTLD